MADPKFTAGSWRLDDGAIWAVRREAGGRTVAVCVAALDDRDTVCVTEADAALMVAAPDLYAALDALVRDGQSAADLRLAYVQARAALAHARGES